MNQKPKFEFTIIIIPDEKSGQFTAFFAQFPQAIAIGDTVEEAQINLIDITNKMLNDQKNQIITQVMEKHNYFTKNIDAELTV